MAVVRELVLVQEPVQQLLVQELVQLLEQQGLVLEQQVLEQVPVLEQVLQL